MFPPHEVEISDDWTLDDWLEVVDALDKPRVYLGTPAAPSDFSERIRSRWIRLKAGLDDPVVDVACDIGCAEGTFTEVWLTLLRRWRNRLPGVVLLIEPEEQLLLMAMNRLEKAFPEIHFKPITNTLEEEMSEDLGLCRTFRPQLVVASHSCYYFKDLRATLRQLATILAPGGVLWLVARDRHCGLYQSRFELLSRFNIPDTAPQQFADAVLEAMLPDWKTERDQLEISLQVPNNAPLQRRVFSFLTHLKVSQAAFDDARTRHDGLFDFSETHINASSHPVISEASGPGDPALTDQDRASLRVVELARSSLLESGALVLDIQLARFDHLQRLVDIRDAPRPDQAAAFRPRHIKGAVSLWGHPPSEESRAALERYFTKHPSFLLYDTFFSTFRAPTISPCLGMFGAQPEHDRPVERLPMVRLDETWLPSWDTSTFDVAWADWQSVLRRLWANVLPTGEFSLKCLAVGSRLGEVLTMTSDEADSVDRSAALFVTFLQRRQGDGATANRALTQAYEHIRQLMGDYVGLTASLRLQERNRQKLVAHQHTVFNALDPCGSVGLLKEDQRLPEHVRLMAADDEKAFRLLRVSLKVAFGRDNEWLPEDLDGLIRLLEENTLSTEAPARVERANNAVWRFGSLEERRDAFTVLVNLWKNAAKCGKNANDHGFTRVRIDCDSTKASVEITNDGEMNPRFLKYVQGHPVVPDPERRGLQDVLDCVDRRQWKLVAGTSSVPPTTTIVVTFTTHRA